MTERKSAASFGLDTPTIIKQSSCPGGITVVFDNHLQKRKIIIELTKIVFSEINKIIIFVDILKNSSNHKSSNKIIRLNKILWM